MANSNFELRKTILVAPAIIYGCKLLRSDSKRINRTLIRSSFNDTMYIMSLIAGETRK